VLPPIPFPTADGVLRHEHIYGSIDDFLLRTDELVNPDERGMLHLLDNARIVLSTLSTLSNPGLDQVGIFSLVPMERLVIDEASQINVFDFMVRVYSQFVCSVYI
jgi:hypothetical protein